MTIECWHSLARRPLFRSLLLAQALLGCLGASGCLVVGGAVMYPVTQRNSIEKIGDPGEPDGRRWPLWLQGEAQKRGVSLEPGTSAGDGDASEPMRKWRSYDGFLWAGLYVYPIVPVPLPVAVPIGLKSTKITVTLEEGVVSVHSTRTRQHVASWVAGFQFLPGPCGAGGFFHGEDPLAGW